MWALLGSSLYLVHVEYLGKIQDLVLGSVVMKRGILVRICWILAVMLNCFNIHLMVALVSDNGELFFLFGVVYISYLLNFWKKINFGMNSGENLYGIAEFGQLSSMYVNESTWYLRILNLFILEFSWTCTTMEKDIVC